MTDQSEQTYGLASASPQVETAWNPAEKLESEAVETPATFSVLVYCGNCRSIYEMSFTRGTRLYQGYPGADYLRHHSDEAEYGGPGVVCSNCCVGSRLYMRDLDSRDARVRADAERIAALEGERDAMQSRAEAAESDRQEAERHIDDLRAIIRKHERVTAELLSQKVVLQRRLEKCKQTIAALETHHVENHALGGDRCGSLRMTDGQIWQAAEEAARAIEDIRHHDGPEPGLWRARVIDRITEAIQRVQREKR